MEARPAPAMADVRGLRSIRVKPNAVFCAPRLAELASSNAAAAARICFIIFIACKDGHNPADYQNIFCKKRKSTYLCSPDFWSVTLERCSSGLRGTPGKRVYAKSVSRVRISVSPEKKDSFGCLFSYGETCALTDTLSPNPFPQGRGWRQKPPVRFAHYLTLFRDCT